MKSPCWLIGIAVLFALAPAYAQQAVQAPEVIENPVIPSNQQERRPLTTRQVSPIEFGMFASGRGGGMLTIDPASGGRRVSGDIALLGSSQYGPAEFEISGQPNEPILIDLPSQALLTSGVPIINLTSYPFGQLALDPSGYLRLRVGGTLQLGGTPPPGTYQGAFDINVRYLRP